MSQPSVRRLLAFAMTFSLLMGCDGDGQNGSGQRGGARQPIRTLSGHQGFVCGVKFSPDGKQLLSGAADGTLRWWDVQTGENLRTIPAHAEWVQGVAVSKDGKLAASGGRDDLVKLWDFATGKLIREFKGHAGIVFTVDFSPDGTKIVSCGADKVAKVWDVASGDCLATIRAPGFFTPKGAFFGSQNDRFLFACDLLSWWDIATGECLQTYEGHTDTVGDVAITEDGRWIASAGSYQDSSLRLWDAKSGECAWVKEFSEQEGGVWALAFADDGATLVSGHHGGDVRYWDVQTGERLQVTPAHDESISAIDASADDKLIATGSWDCLIKLWPHQSPSEQESPADHTEED